MVIVIVVDTFVGAKRGIPLAANKLEKLLTGVGHEVRVVTCGKSSDIYRVKKMWIPYLSFMAAIQGLCYGKPDEDVLREAFKGADIVHLMLPFPLEDKAEFIARHTETPVIASFGTTARGFLSIAGIGWFTALSGAAYRTLRSGLFKRCKNVICHSQEIHDALQKHEYSANLHLIDEAEFDDAAAVSKIEAAYAQAIADDMVTYSNKSRQIFKRNWAVCRSSIDVTQPYKKNGWFFRGWYTWTYIWVVGLSAIADFFVYGLHVEGHKNLRDVKSGAISVSNHIHNIDCTMVAAALAPHRMTFTSIEGNFRLPVVRWLIKWLGVVPIPTSTHALRGFFDHTVQFLKDGKKVHFYPEGSLWQYYTGLRPFKKGAFHMAVDAGVPIIPVALVQRPASGLRRIFRKKPLFKVVICPAVYADPALAGARQIEDLRDRTHQAMCKALEKDQYDKNRELALESAQQEAFLQTSLTEQES